MAIGLCVRAVKGVSSTFDLRKIVRLSGFVSPMFTIWLPCLFTVCINYYSRDIEKTMKSIERPKLSVDPSEHVLARFNVSPELLEIQGLLVLVALKTETSGESLFLR